MKNGVRKNLRAGQKSDFRPGIFRVACDLQFALGVAQFVFLVPHLAVAADRQAQQFGQGIYYGDTDAMQPAGYFVGITIEFATGMQHGQNHFSGRATFFSVVIGRDPTPVVTYGDRAVGMYGHVNRVTKSGQGLIDGVIHHLEDHVMQASPVVGITDVHSWAFAYSIQPFQDLDI